MEKRVTHYLIENAVSLELNGMTLRVPTGTIIKVRKYNIDGELVVTPIEQSTSLQLTMNEKATAKVNKIMAIKDFRERTDLGLKEAKAIIDTYLEENK